MALNRVIVINNVSTEGSTYAGQLILAGESYQIQDSIEYDKFSSCAKLMTDIFVEPARAVISSDSQTYDDPFSGFGWLMGSSIEVTPTTNKNEYSLTTAGLDKAVFNPSLYVSTITLSAQSGSSYTYTSSLVPGEEDAICTGSYTTRVYIEDVDTENSTLTLQTPLPVGTYDLSKHYHIDYPLPPVPEGHINWYLWGMRFKAKNFAEDDWLMMEICLPELGIDLKRYDECWISHLQDAVTIMSPDGAPGPVPSVVPIEGFGDAQVVFRLDYYPTQTTNTTTSVWYDYILEVKDGD